MISLKIVGVSLIAMCLAGSAKRPADGEPVADSENSRKAVEAWLNALSKDHTVPIPPKIVAVDDAMLTRFRDDHFYVIRYMRYPRAVKPPDPLKLENLVRVRRDGSVERIASLDALKELFAKQLSALKTEAEARNSLLALLRLAQEFYQDGQYTFSVPENSISVVRKGNGLIASGKSVVTKGGHGEITATFNTEDPNKIEVTGKVRSDVRLR